MSDRVWAVQDIEAGMVIDGEAFQVAGDVVIASAERYATPPRIRVEAYEPSTGRAHVRYFPIGKPVTVRDN